MRHVPRPVDEVLDEVEQAVVRPLDVLEDEDERMLLGQRLEEAPPRGERLLLRAGRTVARLPDQRTQMRQHPLRVSSISCVDRARQLRLDLVVAVGLENRRPAPSPSRQAPSS